MRKQSAALQAPRDRRAAHPGRRRELKYPNLEALYVAVGEGHVSPQSVVARLARSVSRHHRRGRRSRSRSRGPSGWAGRRLDRASSCAGSRDVWVRLGRCCTPVPGDEIIGFVTRGQGVSVHRTDCPNVKSLRQQPERLDRGHLVGGQAHLVHRRDPGRGARPHAAAVRRGHRALRQPCEHPVGHQSATGKDRITRLRFTFELADIAHLSSVLAAVKRVDSVYDAYRVVPS